MKLVMCEVIVAGAVAALAAAGAGAAEAKPPADLGRCVITVGGVAIDPAPHAVVIPDKPTPQEQRAAEDLADHLERLTAKRPPVVAEGRLDKQTPIVVGRCTATLEKLGVKVDFDAPGIAAYRKELAGVLGQRPVNSLPHEEIIAKLDKAGEVFRILILETNMTLPYTSVFLELDCGYWTAEAEQRLRDAIKAAK